MSSICDGHWSTEHHQCGANLKYNTSRALYCTVKLVKSYPEVPGAISVTGIIQLSTTAMLCMPFQGSSGLR